MPTNRRDGREEGGREGMQQPDIREEAGRRTGEDVGDEQNEI